MQSFGTFKKKLFLFHVLDCNAIFANQDLLPTSRPGNFDLHTKMPGSAPAWAVVHKCPVCADLLLVGRRSERLCRRLVIYLEMAFSNKRRSQKHGGAILEQSTYSHEVFTDHSKRWARVKIRLYRYVTRTNVSFFDRNIRARNITI